MANAKAKDGVLLRSCFIEDHGLGDGITHRFKAWLDFVLF